MLYRVKFLFCQEENGRNPFFCHWMKKKSIQTMEYDCMIQETVEKIHQIVHMITSPVNLSWEYFFLLNRCKYLGKPGLSKS